jgi:hypothetical protein
LILAVKSGNFDENAAEKMPRDVWGAMYKWPVKTGEYFFDYEP